MRIVLDLQGAQIESRSGAIGRYSFALAQAIAREASRHEVWLLLSGRYPDSIEPLRVAFADLIPLERIRVVELPGPVAEEDLSNAWRKQAAELLREKFLGDLSPDIVHLSTMLEGCGKEVVVSAGRFNPSICTSATLYHLIPLLRPETYLCNPAIKRSYLRHAHSLKRTDLMLAVSEYSRREAIEALQLSPELITTIGVGVEPFHKDEVSFGARAAIMAHHGLQRPFVLCTSAAESRQVAETLVDAFALLPQELRSAHQLVMVGKLPGEDHKGFAAIARKRGLSDNEIVCLDYVADEDLRLLYATCSVFVFSSRHESLGLPVLDAMICGAPVIGSNCRSIPEVINREDALFDPERPRDIANHMAVVLSSAELRHSLKAWGRERASVFTWAASARKALDAFEALHERAKGKNAVTIPSTTQYKPALAFIAPLPPAETAIAGYAAQLLPNLARYYEITCIVDQPTVTDPWITAEFTIRDLQWFEANAERFERTLYQLGNSPFCKHMFTLLQQQPGIAALHDFYLGAVVDWMEKSGYSPGSFTRAIYDSHGFAALAKDHLDGRATSIEAFPCNASVLRTSLGVIAHTPHVSEQARTWYGDHVPTPIRQLPYFRDGAQTSELSPLNHLDKIGAFYRDFIEEIYATSSQAAEQNLIKAIARAPAPAQPAQTDLVNFAAAVAANRERFGPPQILIDLTVLAGHDARTGIQRVTRGILMALITDPPAGYRIEPVRADGDLYVYARRFTCRCMGVPEEDLIDDLVEVGNGDVFLGVEWGAGLTALMKPWFLRAQRRGMQVVFVVHDLLTLLCPELFPPIVPALGFDWMKTVAELADRVACVSRTVADEVFAWLGETRPQRLRPLLLGFFHHGADLHASLPSKGMPDNAEELLTKLRSRPSFLMVATIEPRKGHRQALDAMEQLWADGVDINLVIVGQQGWKMEDFAQRMQQHPERNNRLFWLQGISDEMLDEVYRSTQALLAASQGEGFGLPLIEAAQHGLPIIARDIPVFREVAGEHAFYFRGESAQALADALRNWLLLGDAIPPSTGMPWLTWKQSSRQLLDVVLGKRWYRSWPDGAASPQSEKNRPALSRPNSRSIGR
jgi:glycosyltransferase involved in cell wall biosynthesis